MIVAQHASHMDPAYFPDPLTFNPWRFISRESTSNGQENLRVKIGQLLPWGIGESQCKGRVLAERECLHFVATFLQNWDVTPVSDASGAWDISMALTIAVARPKQKVTVRIHRRKTRAVAKSHENAAC